MPNLEIWLERAFQLAYFLHGDRKTAVAIAGRAMNKLEVAATVQSKRLYYEPTGRGSSRKARTRVSLSDPHLLQRLVYVESEEYERQKEEAARNGGSIEESELVIHFIKHLVRITMRRNSFYVTLGLCRLLHNYTSPETMSFYNLVVQDPERVRDDYYYRSRKSVLIGELKQRFGDFIQLTRGPRREERFMAMDDCSRHRRLVRDCLQWFTPWATGCVVPDTFDPFTESIDKLHFSGQSPDEEHEVEVNRIHSVIHPECFGRLAAANGFDRPGDRLQVPTFSFANRGDGSGPDRQNGVLSEEERQAITELLAQEAARRRAVGAGLLRVLVDGAEVARLDPHGGRTAQFRVDEGAELIEVYGEDRQGQLLLATRFVSAGAEPQLHSITLEGGQTISFAITPQRDPSGALSGAVITSVYEGAPTAGAIATAGLWARTWLRALTGLSEGFSRAWRPAAALATLVLLIAGLWWFWQQGKPEPPKVVKDQPITAPGDGREENEQPSTSQQAGREKPVNPNESHDSGGEQIASVHPDEVTRRLVRDPLVDGGGTTRAGDPTGKRLEQVRRVYIDVTGSGVLREQLLANLNSHIAAQGVIEYARIEQADAALKLSVKPASSASRVQKVIVVVQMVNADGDVLWPTSRRGSSWRYEGPMDRVSTRLMSDLVQDISQSKPRRSSTKVGTSSQRVP